LGNFGEVPLEINPILLPFLVLSAAVPVAFAQHGRLLVAQKGDTSLAIVDPVAGAVIASVDEGGTTGHEVAGSPDGKVAVVPIYGNSGVGKPGTDGKNIVVIDLASHKIVSNIEFDHGVRPHCPVFGPKDGMLYVTTELDHSITVIDPKTWKIVGVIPTGQPESHMLTIAHDGLRGYTANVGPGTVSVLDMKARKNGSCDSDLWDDAADYDFERRPLGVYSRPDQAADGGDRYGDEQGEDVGSAERAWLRSGGEQGWKVAADADSVEERCGRCRPRDDESCALGGGGRRSARGADGAWRKGGICLMCRSQSSG